MQAADVAATQNEVITAVVIAVAALTVVVTVVVVALRIRRRSTGVRARAVITPVQRALPPPPYPESVIDAPITAPGRLQSPKVEFEPPGSRAVHAD